MAARNTPRQELRRNLLAKVHIAKKQTGCDRATYEALLARTTGVSSARDMTTQQLELVIHEFRRLGWKPRTRTGKRISEKAAARKIWAIWTEMGREGLIEEPSRPALRSFVRRMTGVGDPEWLSPTQSQKVIEGLKSWKARLERKQGGAK